jgi:hypothetical protein
LLFEVLDVGVRGKGYLVVLGVVVFDPFDYESFFFHARFGLDD